MWTKKILSWLKRESFIFAIVITCEEALIRYAKKILQQLQWSSESKRRVLEIVSSRSCLAGEIIQLCYLFSRSLAPRVSRRAQKYQKLLKVFNLPFNANKRGKYVLIKTNWKHKYCGCLAFGRKAFRHKFATLRKCCRPVWKIFSLQFLSRSEVARLFWNDSRNYIKHCRRISINTIYS